MTPVLLLAPDLAADPDREVLAERLRLRGTALVPVEGAPGHRPLMRAAAGRPAWLATGDSGWIAAAGTAGLVGVVLVGGSVPVEGGATLVIARAEGLLDAPRVMIPPGGGCWHG